MTTDFASKAVAVSCCGDGEDGNACTSLFSFDTDELSAPVSVGKSLLADATSVFALVSTFWSCDFSALSSWPTKASCSSRSIRR